MQSHVISEKTKSHLVVHEALVVVSWEKSSEVSAMFVNLARNALYLFFAASKSSTHEYYMLLLLEGRFEGSSLKLKHPSRQRILLCWSPFAQEPQNLFVVFFWSHRAMFIGWSACFQIFATSLSFISALARTDFDFDTVTPASVFDNGFSNQCDMISFISFAAYRSDLVYQDLTSSFFSLEKSIWRNALWYHVLRILFYSYIFTFFRGFIMTHFQHLVADFVELLAAQLAK